MPTSKVTGVDVRKTSIRLQFTDHTGFRHRETIKDAAGNPIPPLAGNVRSAEKTMERIRAAISLGTFQLRDYFPDSDGSSDKAEEPIPTLGEQLKAWFDGLKVAPSTLNGYRAAVNFWMVAQADGTGKLLADVRINELVFSQIRHGLAVGTSRHRRGKIGTDKPPKPLSAKTSNNYLAVLRSALDLAVDDELILKSPAGEGKKLRAKVQKGLPDPLDLEQLESVLARLHIKNPAVADYAEFWAFTGLRTSELNGLKWNSTDLRQNSIRIHEVRIKGKEKRTTKTNVTRDVPLDSRARAALDRQRARTQIAGGLVWLNPTDNLPWDGDRDFLRSFWTPALKALGIRYRRPYNLRHTRATMLLMAGVNPSLAARWLGHDKKTFFDTYAKWIDSVRDVGELAKVEAFTSTKAHVPAEEVAHVG